MTDRGAVDAVPTRIDVGDGDFVDLTVLEDGRWRFEFIAAPTRAEPRPPVERVQVEAIDGEGHISPLMVATAPAGGWIEASGHTNDAAFVRVAVPHGGHMHVRSTGIPGRGGQRPKRGPSGGCVADMGQGSLVEVLADSSGRLSLRFLRESGGRDAPPAPESVRVESIAPDGIVRPLLVTRDGPTALAATGSIGGIDRVRIILMHDGHDHAREVGL